MEMEGRISSRATKLSIARHNEGPHNNLSFKKLHILYNLKLKKIKNVLNVKIIKTFFEIPKVKQILYHLKQFRKHVQTVVIF